MIDISKVSCCLITKEDRYPKEILEQIQKYPFGEILILTHSDSPHRKHELFAKAKFDLIYYQDDDAICPIVDLIEKSDVDRINVAMKQGHYEAYINTRATMGLGWGSIFHKDFLKTLSIYTDVHGEDEVYQRETERILTYLNYPQNRIVAEVEDLPSAMAADRLWRQPNHNQFRQIAEDRCRAILGV